MIKKNWITGIVMLFVQVSFAQENLDFSGKAGMVSPLIKGEEVRFQLLAPDAQQVRLLGNWLPTDTNHQAVPIPLVKNEQGVWTVDVELEPDLYTYNFVVDGVKTTDPNNVYEVRDVSSVMNMFLVDGEKSHYYKVNDVPHGTVAKRWYASAGLQMTRRISIYTPPNYEISGEQYPVLYLLHGVGGDEEAWLTLGRTAEILDNLIAEGKMKPMIVVMPNGHTSNSAAPGYSSKGFYKPIMFTPDVFNGEMETYFPEIISFVEENYRTKKTKSGRAIAGLSMGGFHSLYISANYPDLFDYVGLFSPAVQPLEGKDATVYQNLDAKLLKQKAAEPKLYWIAIGKDDFLYNNVKAYRANLKKLGFQFTFVESDGGHTWANWRDYLRDFTPLLFR